MIRNPRLLEEWEKKWMADQPVDFSRNLLIFEGLFLEARALGILPLKDPLEGLQAKIELAKALNVSGNH